MSQLVVPLVIIIGVPAAAVKLPVHQAHLAYAGLGFYLRKSFALGRVPSLAYEAV